MRPSQYIAAFQRICCCVLLLLLCWDRGPRVSAWIPTQRRKNSVHRSSSLRLNAALPPNYKEIGNELIYKAASIIGAVPEQIDIEWKGERIVVRVNGENVYVSDPPEDAALAAELGIDVEVDPPIPGGVDVTALARAINAALDDDGGVGSAIAEVHEIEVTSPGASDELAGIMFESYRGFDVIVEQQDPKTKIIKKVEGKLVERNDEFTILNIMGRMKSMKNQTVLSVKLPKAKREKGVL